MKKLLLVVAVASSLAIVGCKPRADTTPPPANAPAPATSSATPPPTEESPMQHEDANMASGDDLALGLLGAVDENEIAAAKQAQAKNVTGAALDYAKMMEREHSENLEKTKTLGTLTENSEVGMVKDKGSQELTTLDKKSGKEYAAAYIDAMIAGHQEALAMIDSKMMPAASSESVKQHLSDTRKHVEQHLAKAQEIKKSM